MSKRKSNLDVLRAMNEDDDYHYAPSANLVNETDSGDEEDTDSEPSSPPTKKQRVVSLSPPLPSTKKQQQRVVSSPPPSPPPSIKKHVVSSPESKQPPKKLKTKVGRFEALQEKHKTKKSDEDKRRSNIKELKLDLARVPELLQVSCYTDIHMNSQYSKKFNYIPNNDDEESGITKKTMMNFILTDMPHCHFMHFPVRSTKITDMTTEETELYEAAVERFNENLMPEHVSTMQLFCPKTGKILSSKHVMFDRTGSIREWTSTQAKILCTNHPSLIPKARDANNRRPATLKQCISTSKTKSGKVIDWHSHIIPECYYSKVCNDKASPKKHKHTKNTPSVTTEETNNVALSDTDWDVVIIRTYTEALMKNSYTDGRICAAMREMMTNVKLQFKLKDSGCALTERDVHWLLFGYLMFSPEGYKNIGTEMLQRPRTTGKAPMAYKSQTSSKRPATTTTKTPS